MSIDTGFQGDPRPRQSRQDDGSNKGPRHGPWEGEVVIFGAESVCDIARGNARVQQVMDGLDVEGFLYLGVGGDGEVEQDEDGDGEEQ